MNGTYRSVRLSVCGPPATGRYHKKSIVGGRLRKKSIVGGRLREKKGRRRRGKEEKRKRGEEEPTFHATSSHVRRRHSRPRALFLPREEKDQGDVVERRKKKNLLFMRRPRPCAVAALACGCFFSLSRRKIEA
ncbi:hypothetical protein B296_00039980, partial [Ensete ventricosum]